MTAGASAAGSIEELHEYRRRIINAFLKARASAAGWVETTYRGLPVLQPFTVFSDIDAPWCPEMVVLPPGEFLMGSPNSDKEAGDNEKPQHRISIGYGFAIGRYPVTFDEYDHFCRATRRGKPADQGWGTGSPTGDQRELGGREGILRLGGEYRGSLIGYRAKRSVENACGRGRRPATCAGIL